MNFVGEKKNFKVKSCHLIFIGMVVLIDLLLFWKARYGYGANDESFYLTVAHRILKGDELLSEEWHMSQMSSVFVLPIMKLYLMVTKTTEGMVLNFRYIFIVVKTVFALIYYYFLNKKYGMWAVGGIAFYLLFTPFNILQMSYNTSGLSFLLLSGVLLITTDMERKYSGVQMVFSGITLACAVLCCPYLVVLYVAVTVAMIVLRLRDRNRSWGILWMQLTLGCLIMAILFLTFVLARTSVGDILANVQEMLKDPEHPIQSITGSMANLVRSIFTYYRVAAIIFVVELAAIPLDALYCRKKQLQVSVKFVNIYLWALVIGILVSLLQLATIITFTYNLIMLPISFLGAMVYYLAFFLKLEKRMKYGPMVLGLYGIIYGTLLNMSSNNQLNIFSCAMTITSLASVLAVGNFYELVKENDRNVKSAAILMISVQCLVLVFSVTQHAFWETKVSDLDTIIAEGPLKGIVTSKEHADEYQAVLKDLSWFRDKEEGNFVYFSEKPYAYLYVDMPYGTHSGWSGAFSTQCVMDERYYELHSDKIPKYIYVEMQYVTESDITAWAASREYDLNILNQGYALVKQ